MNIWGSGIRNRPPGNGVTLPNSVESRRQMSNSTPDEEDLSLTLLLNETALPPASSSYSTHNTTSTNNSRQYPFDLQRHPYTISLDQAKDSTSKPLDTLSQKDYHLPSRDHLAREQLARDHLSRDPLREIKDNSRDSGRPLKQEAPSESSSRRQRLDITNWVKNKFNSDELSLPNVPGGNDIDKFN